MSQNVAVRNPFASMAGRLHMQPQEVESLMKNTLMKAKGNNAQVSNEELMVFMAIANEYKLNPLSKEIYAFNNRGAIQPIVSIDGWLKIINQHPEFDGMEFVDISEGGQLVAVTCRIFRKDRARATEVTEYMDECRGTSEPWKKWPARMLRHKATIQSARYAFGLSGIVDPDEAERMKETTLERDITPAAGITSALQAIQSAQSLEELDAAGKAAAAEHPGQRAAFVSAYNQRKDELQKAAQKAAQEAVVAEQQPEPVMTEEEAQAAADLGWGEQDDDIPGV